MRKMRERVLSFAVLGASFVSAAIVLSGPSARAQSESVTESVTVNCKPVGLGNSAAIEGTLVFESTEAGATTSTVANGLIDLTLKRQGKSEPINIGGLSVTGEVTFVPSEPDSNGKIEMLRAIKIANPGREVSFLVISLDLPGPSSWVRMADGTLYRSICK